MRFVDQNAATKAISGAGATTVTFTSADFDAAGVVMLLFLFTGAGNNVGTITRLRVKNQGITSHDVALAHWRAFVQRWYTFAPATADVAFMIPFGLPDPFLPYEVADSSQMLRGPNPQIEVAFTAAAAGTLQMGWVKTDQPAKIYPTLLGSAMQIAASSSAAHYPIADPGTLKGFGINTTGLTRCQLTLNGRKRFNLEGTTLLGQRERFWPPQALADPIHVDVGGPETPLQGASFYEADTAGGWGGATNEVSQYLLRPQ